MTKKPSYLGPSDVARRLGVTRDAVYKLLAVHPLDNDAWGANGTPMAPRDNRRLARETPQTTRPVQEKEHRECVAHHTAPVTCPPSKMS